MIGRVKPLEWVEVLGGLEFLSAGKLGRLYSVRRIGSVWAWSMRGAEMSEYEFRWCKSAEAAKAECEAHWREFLFGPDGPLEVAEVSA